MSNKAYIQLDGVTKKYSRGGEELVVLDALDLKVPEGDYVALMGPSGSGKTTILNLVGGLDIPDSGKVSVADTEVANMPKSQLPAWRARHVGFVFQSFNLLPVLTAHENVMLPLQLTPLSKSERKIQADFALEIVGLSDRASHRPSQLSGGQEQRVAIARAIATDPDVIIADEPTGDLDRNSADEILQILDRLNSEMGKTILMVTHDPAAAASARRLLKLDKGTLVSDQTREGA
ncbi:MAG: ATP-binding cassette domain-containing protein [Planctomycetia bacterium]|jgi:putative ABC transport system ATP-binding protein|nr:ATP-binding cassette domain-containing protein [Planctomycetia bacterium]NCF98678.1 ATP-binding cassette domain-containing protein [Planctomycetia bacterium]NCG13630.1 ATP-binding cassette domain-containing protein [Planctomycetia bacterium]